MVAIAERKIRSERQPNAAFRPSPTSRRRPFCRVRSLLLRRSGYGGPVHVRCGYGGLETRGPAIFRVLVGLRFYQPEAGRWANRDPLVEIGRARPFFGWRGLKDVLDRQIELRPYQFNGNNGVDGIDVLGLNRCCGPDVSATMLATLDDLNKTFASWSFRTKASKCQALDAVFTLFYAWDVDQLMSLGLKGNYRLGDETQQGSGQNCERTVAFGPGPSKRKCYYASSVGYLLYGRMRGLCNSRFEGIAGLGHHSLNDTLWSIELYKDLWYPVSEVRDLSFRTWYPVTLAKEQAKFFATSGYKQSFNLDGWNNTRDCIDCPVLPGNVLKMDKFDWTWFDVFDLPGTSLLPPQWNVIYDDFF